MRVVQNSFTRKRTSSPQSSPNKKFPFAKPSPYPCLTLAVHQASIEQDLGQMSHRNFSVVAAHSDSMFLHSILVLAHLHRPVLTLPHPNCSTHLLQRSLSKPTFRPPSLQAKVVFRQGFSKIFAKLSRKINLYIYVYIVNWNIFHSPIQSQNAQGPDIMGRTKDTKVMCLGLPWPSFLVNMLLNIGRDYIHITYTWRVFRSLVPKIGLITHFLAWRLFC